MNKIITVIVSLFIFAQGFSQNVTVLQYIQKFKDIAIAEMKRSGIPASITLAQGILESESGNSPLTLKSNNHFGIKCKSSWQGETVSHDDDASGECFRKYNNPEESYKDHSDFLKAGKHYASLFNLKPDDYKGWAYGLKKAGYATNPRYPEILIRFIEKYDLQQYTRVGLTEKNADDIADNQNQINYPVIQTKVINNVSATPHVKTKNLGLDAVQVFKGTSLLAIATAFDIPLFKLMEYNDIQNEGILQKDQWIYLERKNKAFSAIHHANGNESMYDISQMYGIQLTLLMEYNQVAANLTPAKGTEVNLNPGKAAAPKSEMITHDVQPKEGLFAISKKYNVSINDLKTLNNLSSDNLKVGQRLIISKN